MNANELRIGNLVYYRLEDGHKKWFSMTEVESQDLLVLSLNIRSNFEPIPITEYWLEEFGFEYNDMILTWVHKDQFIPSLTLTNNGSYIVDGMAFSPELRYVHQLQNLFFALTGKELEIKKPFD